MIMILVGVWIVVRYLVPKNWKEWRNAGLLHAFIIALYVEMYGFPLTIYLLTGFLGLDIPWIHYKGHLWSTLPTLLLFPAIVWLYYHLAKKEERRMLARFGEEYEAYMRRTPMFFPRVGDWGKALVGRQHQAG